MRSRTVVLCTLAAGLVGVFVGGAVADQRAPDPVALTAADCEEAASLYATVGREVADNFGEACPDREAVLTDIATGEPSADIAGLCRESISRGAHVALCEEFLGNREQYVAGVAELEKQGIDLDEYESEEGQR